MLELQDKKPELQDKKVEDLVRDLQLALGNPDVQNWGSAVFLIGAGCSRSAGIKLAGEIAEQCVIDLASKYSNGELRTEKATDALKWLHNNEVVDKKWYSDEPEWKPEWGNLYGEIFQKHFKSPVHQREIILEAIDKSGDKINWAHLCLGELVKRGYIHTVLTTNFDQLVLQGIIRTGLLPVIADGVESLTRVSSQPKRPQVVHLHGSMHTYSPRNSTGATHEAGQKLPMKGMFYNLLKDCSMLVVVGYAGGEEGIMKLLKEAAEYLSEMVVYWVMYEEEHASLSKDARELLSLDHNKFIITNYDADKLFAEIMEGLGIGVPEWMVKPTGTLLKQSQGFALPQKKDSQKEEIPSKIKSYQEKIQRLHELWAATVDQSVDPLDGIITLRLAGKHEDALVRLRKLEDVNDSDIWRMHADSAYEVGQRLSDQNLIQESIAAWRRVLELTEENSTAWYGAQIGMGKAFQFLYEELDPNRQHLEQAVTAYRAALDEGSQTHMQLDWAYAQNNLGIALQTLGGLEKKAELIEEAIKAHHAALEIYTRKRAPLDWAETQNNLGGALQILGELKNDIPLLAEAVASYQAALDVFTRDLTGEAWAGVQNNLGGALQKLGELKASITFFERAGAAYQAALEFYRESGEVNRVQLIEEDLERVQKLLEQLRSDS